jgi:Bacterial protein of unknown function (DUF937)
MSTNLVSLVMQFVTPDMIARIAAALGLDRSMAQKAIGASVPALLAALAGVATKPDGARQLSNALTEQQPGMFDRLINALGGSGQKAAVESGSSLLSNLLGSGTVNALSSAVGSYTGLNAGTSKSLFGMLAPMVMGGLAQQQRAQGLDTSELVTLLALQKDQIASSIPAGLANQLSGAGLLDTVDSGLRTGAEAASAAAGRIGRASERAVTGATQAAYATQSSASSYWPWLAALALLLGGLWYFLSGPTADRVAEQPPPATRAPAETTGRAAPAALASLNVGGVNLADQISSSVDQMKTVLTGMTDAASAQAALPKLRQTAAQLDRVNSLAAQLPPDGKRAIAGLIETAMPTIKQLCDKALATPGVSEIAKPAIDELRVKLDSLARA